MRSNFQIIRKHISSILALLFAISAICIQPAQAQSQDRQQEIQQLKDKLQQLDQSMGEIKALESQAPQPATSHLPPTSTPAGDLNTIFEFELFGTGVDVGQTTERTLP